MNSGGWSIESASGKIWEDLGGLRRDKGQASCLGWLSVIITVVGRPGVYKEQRFIWCIAVEAGVW